MKRKGVVAMRCCPSCKGTNLGGEVATPCPGFGKTNDPQIHVQCLDCKTVLFIPDRDFISPSFCGSPKEHYFDLVAT